MKKLTTVSFLLAVFTTAAYAGDPKAGSGAPATPAADKKAPDAGKPAPADKKAPEAAKPAPAMEAPKPPQEVADMAKGMVGTWKCTGQATHMGNTQDFKATMTIKLDLDKWWIQGAFSGTMGKMTHKFTSYTGYDATNKKWHRYGVDSMGGAREQTSSGMTDGKAVWEGNGSMMGQPIKVRDTEELAKDGKSLHSLGEISMDGGKTWNKGHDATCKK
jgi:hypothetical protein